VDELWFAAFGLLALLSVLNALMLVATMRQVGVLHQRVSPTGAGAANGPAIGARLPALQLQAVNDGLSGAPYAERAVTVLAYVAPGCSLCEELLPSFAAFAGRAPDTVQMLLATDAAPENAAEYAEEHGLKLAFVRADNLAREWQIPGSPYVVAVRQDDPKTLRVLAAGIVNSLEQLEDVAAVAVENQAAILDQFGAAPGPASLTASGNRRDAASSSPLSIHTTAPPQEASQ
jgi:methylamine dehydrogenase accessory protein MauD